MAGRAGPCPPGTARTEWRALPCRTDLIAPSFPLSLPAPLPILQGDAGARDLRSAGQAGRRVGNDAAAFAVFRVRRPGQCQGTAGNRRASGQTTRTRRWTICSSAARRGWAKRPWPTSSPKAWRSNIKCTSGPTIEKAGDLAGLLTNLEQGDVLFIDEIHRLQKTHRGISLPGDGGFQAGHHH